MPPGRVPVGRWRPSARGATVIHVDPRFTRTSAVGDLHVPIRAGTDIVFLGALINHVLSNDLYFKEYVAPYTNAPPSSTRLRGHRGPRRAVLRVRPGDAASTTWRRWPDADGGGAERGTSAAGRRRRARPTRRPARRRPARRTGGHTPGCSGTRPCNTRSCVFQILKRHFARYTPEMVQEVCGISPEQFAQVADAADREQRPRAHHRLRVRGGLDAAHASARSTSGPPRSCSCCSATWGAPAAASWRCAATPASRGPRDIPTLFNLLPGYLPMPNADLDADASTSTSTQDEGRKGFWGNSRRLHGQPAQGLVGRRRDAPRTTSASTTCPRLTGDHGTYQTVWRMLEGEVEGYFLLGQNPAVGSAHGRMQRLGMANLDWLVVRDLQHDRVRDVLEGRPGDRHRRAEHRGHRHRGVLPARRRPTSRRPARSPRRSGCCSGTHKAVEPPGDCRSELQFFYELGKRIREQLAGLHRRAGPAAARPDVGLPGRRARRADAEAVLARSTAPAPPTASRSRATPSCAPTAPPRCGLLDLLRRVRRRGQPGAPAASPRRSRAGSRREWGWAWPANRRILYNRASADPDGKPWSERKRYVWWDDDAGASLDRRRRARLPRRPAAAPVRRDGARARTRSPATTRSSCRPTARAGCSRRAGMVDGPLPTHYEPQESPVAQRAVPAAAATRRGELPRKDNRTNPSEPEPGGRRLPLRVHHLPAHRAPHRGRDEPLAAVPRRAAAGVLLRGVPGARGRAGPRARRLGHDHHAPARRSRPGCWSPSG